MARKQKSNSFRPVIDDDDSPVNKRSSALRSRPSKFYFDDSDILKDRQPSSNSNRNSQLGPSGTYYLNFYPFGSNENNNNEDNLVLVNTTNSKQNSNSAVSTLSRRQRPNSDLESESHLGPATIITNPVFDVEGAGGGGVNGIRPESIDLPEIYIPEEELEYLQIESNRIIRSSSSIGSNTGSSSSSPASTPTQSSNGRHYAGNVQLIDENENDASLVAYQAATANLGHYQKNPNPNNIGNLSSNNNNNNPDTISIGVSSSSFKVQQPPATLPKPVTKLVNLNQSLVQSISQNPDVHHTSGVGGSNSATLPRASPTQHHHYFNPNDGTASSSQQSQPNLVLQYSVGDPNDQLLTSSTSSSSFGTSLNSSASSCCFNSSEMMPSTSISSSLYYVDCTELGAVPNNPTRIQDSPIQRQNAMETTSLSSSKSTMTCHSSSDEELVGMTGGSSSSQHSGSRTLGPSEASSPSSCSVITLSSSVAPSPPPFPPLPPQFNFSTFVPESGPSRSASISSSNSASHKYKAPPPPPPPLPFAHAHPPPKPLPKPAHPHPHHHLANHPNQITIGNYANYATLSSARQAANQSQPPTKQQLTTLRRKHFSLVSGAVDFVPPSPSPHTPNILSSFVGSGKTASNSSSFDQQSTQFPMPPPGSTTMSSPAPASPTPPSSTQANQPYQHSRSESPVMPLPPPPPPLPQYPHPPTSPNHPQHLHQFHYESSKPFSATVQSSQSSLKANSPTYGWVYSDSGNQSNPAEESHNPDLVPYHPHHHFQQQQQDPHNEDCSSMDTSIYSDDSRKQLNVNGQGGDLAGHFSKKKNKRSYDSNNNRGHNNQSPQNGYQVNSFIYQNSAFEDTALDKSMVAPPPAIDDDEDRRIRAKINDDDNPAYTMFLNEDFQQGIGRKGSNGTDPKDSRRKNRKTGTNYKPESKCIRITRFLVCLISVLLLFVFLTLVGIVLYQMFYADPNPNNPNNNNGTESSGSSKGMPITDAIKYALQLAGLHFGSKLNSTTTTTTITIPTTTFGTILLSDQTTTTTTTPIIPILSTKINNVTTSAYDPETHPNMTLIYAGGGTGDSNNISITTTAPPHSFSSTLAPFTTTVFTTTRKPNITLSMNSTLDTLIVPTTTSEDIPSSFSSTPSPPLSTTSTPTIPTSVTPISELISNSSKPESNQPVPLPVIPITSTTVSSILTESKIPFGNFTDISSETSPKNPTTTPSESYSLQNTTESIRKIPKKGSKSFDEPTIGNSSSLDFSSTSGSILNPTTEVPLTTGDVEKNSKNLDHQMLLPEGRISENIAELKNSSNDILKNLSISTTTTTTTENPDTILKDILEDITQVPTLIVNKNSSSNSSGYDPNSKLLTASSVANNETIPTKNLTKPESIAVIDKSDTTTVLTIVPSALGSQNSQNVTIPTSDVSEVTPDSITTADKPIGSQSISSNQTQNGQTTTTSASVPVFKPDSITTAKPIGSQSTSSNQTQNGQTTTTTSAPVPVSTPSLIITAKPMRTQSTSFNQTQNGQTTSSPVPVLLESHNSFHVTTPAPVVPEKTTASVLTSKPIGTQSPSSNPSQPAHSVTTPAPVVPEKTTASVTTSKSIGTQSPSSNQSQPAQTVTTPALVSSSPSSIPVTTTMPSVESNFNPIRNTSKEINDEDLEVAESKEDEKVETSLKILSKTFQTPRPGSKQSTSIMVDNFVVHSQSAAPVATNTSANSASAVPTTTMAKSSTSSSVNASNLDSTKPIQ